jgi:two-component system chemotaxis response regulator CheB
VTAPITTERSRIVVVDDSPVQRRFLRAAVEASTDLTVVGEARNGKEAVALVARLRPAAVLMDLDLPVMSGIEAIERIMAASPTPILVYSAHVNGEESANALEALAAGAVDVLAKPGPEDTTTLDDYADQVRKRLRVATRVRVITHPRGKLRSRGIPAAAPLRAVDPLLTFDIPVKEGVRLIAIGASTGGPQALHTVLKGLPLDLDQAIVVVQHMADGFIPGLASWLDHLIALPVVVGQSGQRLQPGTVTIAPSGFNLLVQDDRLRVLCVPPEPGQFHVPGIDACFESIAQSLGPDAVGVLLTGMGRDGAAGLRAMRDRGATTLGQDEATSTVYGMPQAAMSLDAIDRQVALDEVAPVLLGLVGRS